LAKSKSERLRNAMQRLDDAGWDLNTIPTCEIISEARFKKGEAPSAVHVSIVKREFTGGSPSGKRGRPTHQSIGVE